MGVDRWDQVSCTALVCLVHGPLRLCLVTKRPMKAVAMTDDTSRNMKTCDREGEVKGGGRMREESD